MIANIALVLVIPFLTPVAGIGKDGYRPLRATAAAVVVATICFALSTENPSQLDWFASDNLKPAIMPLLMRLDGFACVGWAIALLALRAVRGDRIENGITNLSRIDDVTAWIAITTSVIMFSIVCMFVTRLVLSNLT